MKLLSKIKQQTKRAWGDAQDGYEHDIVTEMNNLARLKGVGLAMTVKDAAKLLSQL
jgi:hypothetical protein